MLLGNDRAPSKSVIRDLARLGYVWREGSLEEGTFELRLERSAGGREAFQANRTGFSGFLLEQSCGSLIFV